MGKSPRKRGSKPENLYERGGIFYARVQVNGRPVRRSLKTRSRDEAKRLLEPWLEQVSPYHGTSRHTFEEAAAEWIEACAGDWKPKTRRRYDTSLTVILPHFQGKFWDQVDKAALQTFIEARKRAGAKVATINRDLTVISGIAKHVRELPGWPDENPVEKLAKKPRRARKWTYIRPPASDIEAIFARMQGTFGDLCQLALLTGARRDELVNLKRHDAAHGKLQLWETKSKFRVVTLSPEAQAIVDRQKAHPRCDHLFVTRNGGPYRRVTEMFREIVLRAQMLAQKEGRSLRRMRFHDLRHEHAIRYLESGGSLYRLQRNLGHSTIKQTEEYLRYLTAEQAAIALEA